MLDLHALRDQFEAFSEYQVEEQQRRAWQLDEACDVLAGCDGDWRALRREAEAADTTWLVARLHSAAPNVTCEAVERPTPITVVASDGSQIFPDRHVEPNCFLLNVSRVAFQYGTTEPPVTDSKARFTFDRNELADLFDAEVGAISAEVVSAMRDEWELRMLLETARAARTGERPIAALADGTLIRWMLRGMRNPEIEEQLIENYTSLLGEFRADGIPLASYVSMPANTEVVNFLRVRRGEADETPERSLEGLMDRWLFSRTLAPGERTAVFESASHIQSEYGDDPICYFYVSIPTPGPAAPEIGRVEMPRWVANTSRHVDHLHALVCSECEKGGGYPMILSEAHEQAVIRGAEREEFYHHLERRARERGVPYRTSQKRAAKQRPLA